MHVAACKASQGLDVAAHFAVAPDLFEFPVCQSANISLNGAVTESIVEPERTASERIVIARTELVGIGDVTRATRDMVIGAHDLYPEECRFAAAILVEDVDANVVRTITFAILEQLGSLPNASSPQAMLKVRNVHVDSLTAITTFLANS